jgi:pimeloyl-ACP methyl ester carboxylesterase
VAQDFDVETLRGRLRLHQFGELDDVPVFCVPGLSSNSRVFDPLGEYREARGRGIVAFDLRGRGWSEVSPAGTYGWENHARDLFETADAMSIDRFDIVGHSMGAFVGMTAVSLDRAKRIRRLVLIDGLGLPTQTALKAIVAGLARLKDPFPSKDAYVEAVRQVGTATPWSEYWDRHYRYDLVETEQGIRPKTDLAAVTEDATYGASHDLRALWPMLALPTLLLRATVPLGGPDGFIVTREDYDAFLHSTPSARGVEIAANHFGIAVDPEAVKDIDGFLSTN